jgi:hypothetical protein
VNGKINPGGLSASVPDVRGLGVERRHSHTSSHSSGFDEAYSTQSTEGNGAIITEIGGAREGNGVQKGTGGNVNSLTKGTDATPLQNESLDSSLDSLHQTASCSTITDESSPTQQDVIDSSKHAPKRPFKPGLENFIPITQQDESTANKKVLKCEDSAPHYQLQYASTTEIEKRTTLELLQRFALANKSPSLQHNIDKDATQKKVSEQTEQRSNPTGHIIEARRNLVTQSEANTPETHPTNSHDETRQNSIQSSANLRRNSAEILEEFVLNRFSTPEPTIPTKTPEKTSTKSHVSFFDIGDYADITFDKFVKDKNYGDGQSENTTSYMVFLEKSLSPNRKENAARRSESPQMKRRQNGKGSNSLPRGARNLSDVSRMFDRSDVLSRNDQTNVKPRSFAEKMITNSAKIKSNELLLASGKTSATNLGYQNFELGSNCESRSNGLQRNDRKTPDLTLNRQSRSPLRSSLAFNVTVPSERARNALRSPNSSESSHYGSIHVEVKSDSSDAPTSPSNSQDSRLSRRLLTKTIPPSSSLDNSTANSTPTKREITTPRLREARANEGRYRSETSARDIEVALECAKQFEAMNARFNALDVTRDRKHSATSSNSEDRMRLETGVNKRELKFDGLAEQQKLNTERLDKILENRKPMHCRGSDLLTKFVTVNNDRSSSNSSRNKGVAISPSSNSEILNISTHRNTINEQMCDSYDHQRRNIESAQIESLKYSSAMQLNQSTDQNPTFNTSSNELAGKQESSQNDVTPLSKQREKLQERLHKSSSNPTSKTSNISRTTSLLLAAKRPSLHEQGAELQKQFTRWHQQLMESPEPAAKTNLRKSGSWNVGLTSSSNDRLYLTGRSYEQLDSIDESAQLEDITPTDSRISGNLTARKQRVDRRVSDSQLNFFNSDSKYNAIRNNHKIEKSELADLYHQKNEKSGVLQSAKSLDRNVNRSNTSDQPGSSKTDQRNNFSNSYILNSFADRFSTDSGKNSDSEKIPDHQITRSVSNLTSIGRTNESIAKPTLKSILKKSIDRSFSSDDSVFAVPPALKFSPTLNKNEPDNEAIAINERIPNLYHRSLQGSLSAKEMGNRGRNMENSSLGNTSYDTTKSNDPNLYREEPWSKDNIRMTREKVFGSPIDRTQFSPPVSPLRKTSPVGGGVGGYAGATSKFSAVQNFQRMKDSQANKRKDNP